MFRGYRVGLNLPIATVSFSSKKKKNRKKKEKHWTKIAFSGLAGRQGLMSSEPLNFCFFSSPPFSHPKHKKNNENQHFLYSFIHFQRFSLCFIVFHCILVIKRASTRWLFEETWAELQHLFAKILMLSTQLTQGLIHPLGCTWGPGHLWRVNRTLGESNLGTPHGKWALPSMFLSGDEGIDLKVFSLQSLFDALHVYSLITPGV